MCFPLLKNDQQDFIISLIQAFILFCLKTVGQGGYLLIPPPLPNPGYALEDFFASKWRTTVSNWGRGIGQCIMMRGANEKYTDKEYICLV